MIVGPGRTRKSGKKATATVSNGESTRSNGSEDADAEDEDTDPKQKGEDPKAKAKDLKAKGKKKGDEDNKEEDEEVSDDDEEDDKPDPNDPRSKPLCTDCQCGVKPHGGWSTEGRSQFRKLLDKVKESKGRQEDQERHPMQADEEGAGSGM